MNYSSVVARRREFDRTGALNGPGADQNEQRGSGGESVTSTQERMIPMKSRHVLKLLSVNISAPLAPAGRLREDVTNTLVPGRAFSARTLTINN